MQKELTVDGQRMRVEVADDEEFQQKLERLKIAGLNVEAAPDSTVLGAALHGAGQGLTLGGSDELYGGYRKVMHGEDYETARNRYRDELAGMREEHPVAFTTGEIGGGFALPGGAAGNALRTARNLSTAGKVGRLAAIGAGTGAATGVGYSTADDTAGIAGDALVGAGLGAALTPAVAYGIPFAGHTARRASNLLGRRADQKADDLVASKLVTGGRSADEVMADLDRIGPEAGAVEDCRAQRRSGA